MSMGAKTLAGNLLFRNANLSVGEGNLIPGNLVVENGKVLDFGPGVMPAAGTWEEVDVGGGAVFPGLVELHSHGALFSDFVDADEQSIHRMTAYYASHGVTTLFPTIATAPKKDVLHSIQTIRSAADSDDNVHIAGIHLEGIFLSHEYRGAHRDSLLDLPDIDFIQQAFLLADGLKLRVTVAPELAGGITFIRRCVEMGIHVSIGHSGADYDLLCEAIAAGANCFTHLFNAMSPLHHRMPGCVGTALCEDGVYAELICDGLHVHPEAVRLAAKAKGPDKLILITDSMSAAGVENFDGQQMIAGLPVTVHDGQARTADGRLAGSMLNLFDGVKNFASMTGIAWPAAIRCATANPARAVGLGSVCGSITKGGTADLIVLAPDWSLERTYTGGRLVYSKGGETPPKNRAE